MKLLFITFWNFDDEAVNGIAKKIRAQQNAFTALGFDVDLCYAKDGSYYWEHDGLAEPLCKTRRFTTRIAAASALSAALKRQRAHYESAYLRYALADRGLLSLVKTLETLKIRLAVEIPTYPYDAEFTRGLLRASLALDRIYRSRVSRHVGRYVIFTDDQEIFGVPTLRTHNGVDPALLALSKSRPAADGTIRLIAVAGFAHWHGYDRLLCGLADYRSGGGARKFTLELVGDGPELRSYENLTSALQLTDAVTFSGFLGGEKLDAAFDRADIAVETLARHRTGGVNSSLKYAEYLVRGLPAISAGRLEIPAALAPYTLAVPESESPVDFDAIASFYDTVCGGGSDALHAAIRAAAAPLCSMEGMMRPVADYFYGERTL